MGTEPKCLWEVGAELGEGALWSPRDKAVWFVDIKFKKIHRLDPASGERKSWDAPQQVGFVLPAKGGRWVAGLQSGLHTFDPVTGAFALLATPREYPAGNRLNDGFVDKAGRLWFGSMADSEQGRLGALYRLFDDGTARVQDANYAITNGPCVSPDGKTLYHTDTIDRVIYAFDLHDDGSLANKREFVRIERPNAYPDGPVVDAEGCLWTALFGGWGIERYSPAGKKIGYVQFPCANVTKAAFGGKDLRTVYATTAKLNLDAKARAEQPLSGGLFVFEVDTPGLAPNEISHGI
jgi:xylono-1,5-lactonase